jgi:alkyl hydroperoxide reductase subunit AhpC
MNNYAANAANILLNNFNTNMDIIKDTEEVPFKLSMDANGNVSLNVNQVAARTDPRLKRAMGMYRYETKSAGRGTQRMAIEQTATETDPVKILANYVTLGTGSNQKEILDIVESLKILAMQSKKIPVDVRSNGVDTLELIRQGIQ